jgi:hypothetical protein
MGIRAFKNPGNRGVSQILKPALQVQQASQEVRLFCFIRLVFQNPRRPKFRGFPHLLDAPDGSVRPRQTASVTQQFIAFKAS